MRESFQAWAQSLGRMGMNLVLVARPKRGAGWGGSPYFVEPLNLVPRSLSLRVWSLGDPGKMESDESIPYPQSPRAGFSELHLLVSRVSVLASRKPGPLKELKELLQKHKAEIEARSQHFVGCLRRAGLEMTQLLWVVACFASPSPSPPSSPSSASSCSICLLVSWS